MIENKYNLTITKIRSLKVGDRTKIKPSEELPFWYNSMIEAWCINESVGKYDDDSYGIQIYDEDASERAGEFAFIITAYNNTMCYFFDKFFDLDDIETKYDLEIQERFLNTINKLIDNGILVF